MDLLQVGIPTWSAVSFTFSSGRSDIFEFQVVCISCIQSLINLYLKPRFLFLLQTGSKYWLIGIGSEKETPF